MNINSYINSKLFSADMNRKDKSELKLQLLDSLNETKQDFLAEGYKEEEAIKKAIDSLEIDDLINSINKNTSEKSFLPNKILSTIIFFIYTFFITKCYINITIISNAFSHLSYIPLKFNLNIINYINTYGISTFLSDTSDSLYLKEQMIFILLLIPIGILIPIVINRYNSLKINITVYILINLLLEFIFRFRHFTFDLFILRIISCILGFYLLKVLLNKFKTIEQ